MSNYCCKNNKLTVKLFYTFQKNIKGVLFNLSLTRSLFNLSLTHFLPHILYCLLIFKWVNTLEINQNTIIKGIKAVLIVEVRNFKETKNKTYNDHYLFIKDAS